MGDRVLVRVEEGEERTNVGLYLPPTAVDNQAVQGGTIVATGPGLPMPSPDSISDEPWHTSSSARRDLYRCRRARATTRCFSGKRRSRSRSRAIGISWFRRRRFLRSLGMSSGRAGDGEREADDRSRRPATSRTLTSNQTNQQPNAITTTDVRRTPRCTDAPGPHPARREGAAHRRRSGQADHRGERARRSSS